MELSLHGKTKGSVTVSDAIFGKDFNEGLVHQVVVAYQAGARSGTRAQKSRNEVSGGGIKPWKQKGTGRARAGSIRSPIWRKGGVTFAAKPQDHSQKVNRKMYRSAIQTIFSELHRAKRLFAVDTFSIKEAKTKLFIEKLKSLKLSDDVLVITENIDPNLILASRNLHKVEILSVEELNPVSLVAHEQVVVTKAAIVKIEEWLS